jgi:hypothetical protein
MAWSALSQIAESFAADVHQKRLFAWMARIRLTFEIYMRCVYTLLIAKDDEIPHIFSGEPPNSFDFVYKQFNDAVLDGKGMLQDEHEFLPYGSFTTMKMFHNAAHGSFKSLILWHSSPEDPQFLASFPSIYLQQIDAYCRHLDHMENCFPAAERRARY